MRRAAWSGFFFEEKHIFIHPLKYLFRKNRIGDPFAQK
jgi:hypothetical protein